MPRSTLGPRPGPPADDDLSEMLTSVVPRARPDTHQFLARAARIRRASPKEVIFRQGEPIPFTFMVRGYASFRRTTRDGDQFVLGLATQGDLFGYSSFAARRASVDLVAVTDAQVALWSGDEFHRLVRADPGLAADAIEGMAEYIVDITERLDFIHQTSRQRVLRALARYGDLFFGQPPVLSRGYLPLLVGTSREMTGRVIRQLEREGMIARVGRTGLRLLSPARLDHAVGSQAEEAS